MWQPGPVWGPAWVAWVEVGDYVGWAPLAPGQWDGFARRARRHVHVRAGARQLAARDVGQQALYLTRLPETGAPAREIVNVGRANGVAFNRGPDFVTLQRMGAPVPERVDASTLPRVKLSAPAVHAERERTWRAHEPRDRPRRLREWRAYKDRASHRRSGARGA